MDTVWTSTVRYAEVDQQGIVFNGHYLTWADEGCTAWFAAVGTTYDALLARGLDMRVRATTLEWTAPARGGDLVEVAAGCEHVGTSSFVVLLAVRAAGQPCCTVRTTYVLVDGGGRPVRVPDDLRERWLPRAPDQGEA